MKAVILGIILILAIALLFFRPQNIVGNSVSDEAFRSHLHLAFNSYSNGPTDGIEEDAITGEFTKNTGMECGLDNFDKSIFESNYSIQKIESSKYGGKIGYLNFTNKPGITFWAWIYNIGDNDNPEYVLRVFCKEIL